MDYSLLKSYAPWAFKLAERRVEMESQPHRIEWLFDEEKNKLRIEADDPDIMCFPELRICGFC